MINTVKKIKWGVGQKMTGKNPSDQMAGVHPIQKGEI